MAQRRALPRRATAAPIAAALLAAAVLAAVPPAAAATRPAAVVAMGDSFISGEAAGSYATGTDGPDNWCHRSTRAEIARTTVPGVEARVNLACSGATTANVVLGGTARYGEAPQAEQLRQVARAYDVRLVVLTIGANDIGFASLVTDCIISFTLGGPDCQDKWTPLIARRAAAARPRVAQAVRDVQAVLREAGYADGAAQVVVQGYASPVPRAARALDWWGQVWAGCPVEKAAMAWAHDQALAGFAAMTRGAASDTGARYLELSGAFDGHEVCAAGATASTEWVRGTFVDPLHLLDYGVSHLEHAVQQSMHPLARGHAQLGACLTEFAARPGREGRCAIGADGNLHATGA